MKKDGVFSDGRNYSYRYGNATGANYKHWGDAAADYIAQVRKVPKYAGLLEGKSFEECVRMLGLRKA
jgi:hypothetical protein